MKVKLDRAGATVAVNYITIIIGEQEFKISVDHFNNLVVNKTYGGDDGSIHITPSVSNEIRIN